MLAENIGRSGFGFRSLKKNRTVGESRPEGYIFTLKLTWFSQILGLMWRLLTCNSFDPRPHSQPDSRLPQFYSKLPLGPLGASCRSGRDLWVQSPRAFLFAGRAGGFAPAPAEQMGCVGYPVTAESTGDEIHHTLAWAWEHVGWF